MKKHLFDVYVEQIKKYLFKKTGLFQFTNFLERSIKNWPISRTGYQFQGEFQHGNKKVAYFQIGVSTLGEIFFRTGCQFGVPGGTYPSKKIPNCPPPPLPYAVSPQRTQNLVWLAYRTRNIHADNVSLFQALTILYSSRHIFILIHQPLFVQKVGNAGTGYVSIQWLMQLVFITVLWEFLGGDVPQGPWNP